MIHRSARDRRPRSQNQFEAGRAAARLGAYTPGTPAIHALQQFSRCENRSRYLLYFQGDPGRMRIHGRTGEGKPRSEVISHGMVCAPAVAAAALYTRESSCRREGSGESERDRSLISGNAGSPLERENYILEKQKIASLRRIREFRALSRSVKIAREITLPSMRPLAPIHF